MSKYCPHCESEYEDKISTCPIDKHQLLDKAPNESKDYFIDFYAAADEIEAERIISYLKSLGIAAQQSRAGISQMPVVNETRFIISVLKTALIKAQKALEEARRDQVISSDGLFLG
jgi:hypothetical protein